MKKNGFSLIELMIAVGIVGILTAIAIPSYSAYVKRANRTDATRSLSATAQALERCYSQTFLYTGCPGAPVGTQASPQGKYNVTIAIPDTTTPGAPPASYFISAVPLAPSQQGDTACQLFTLNTINTQFAQDSSAAQNSQTCWGST